MSCSDGHTPDPQVMFAMDRGIIVVHAIRLLKEAGVTYDANDVLNMAEFLAGDNLPGGFNSEETDSSSDGQDADVAE